APPSPVARDLARTTAGARRLPGPDAELTVIQRGSGGFSLPWGGWAQWGSLTRRRIASRERWIRGRIRTDGRSAAGSRTEPPAADIVCNRHDANGLRFTDLAIDGPYATSFNLPDGLPDR